MTLFKTHDGQFGWQKKRDAKVRWFETEFSAKMYGAAVTSQNEYDVKDFIKEFDVAIKVMTNKGHNQAEFGIFGSFIYSKPTEF